MQWLKRHGGGPPRRAEWQEGSGKELVAGVGAGGVGLRCTIAQTPGSHLELQEIRMLPLLLSPISGLFAAPI